MVFYHTGPSKLALNSHAGPKLITSYLEIKSTEGRVMGGLVVDLLVINKFLTILCCWIVLFICQNCWEYLGGCVCEEAMVRRYICRPENRTVGLF